MFTQALVISLGNHPGAIALTRTPLSAQLAARFCVKVTTAPFVAWYADGIPLMPFRPATEDRFMIDPPLPSASIRCPASRQQYQRPKRLSCTVCSNISSVIFSGTVPASAIYPALFTSTSTRPYFETDFSNKFATSADLVTSHAT